MTNIYKSKPVTWTLIFLFCIIWFYALGARTLIPTDEGRYAEMAREMLASGDWITTRLNGIKYFEKPPLQIWMTALAFKVFGLGEWQARLWTGLCGLLGIFLVGYAGRRVFSPRIGFTAAIVLASSLYWAALGHLNTLDMGLSAMMAVALCSLLIAQRNDANPGEQRGWMLACWAGMALAVLSKGLVGLVLPGAVLVLYTLASRDWAIWKRMHFGPGLLVFFAITAPWFVLVSLKNQEFAQFFFIHEHLQRFTTKIHKRTGPWHYFIPILVLGIMPWLGVLAQSLWNGRRDASAGFQPRKMLLIWAVFIFFFFSISNSKLSSYILPIFPALALLIACYLDEAPAKAVTISAALFGICNVGILAFVPKLTSLADIPYKLPLYQAYQPWIAAGAIVGILGSTLAIWLLRHQRQWSIVSLGGAAFLTGQLLTLGYEPLGRYAAGVDLVPAIKAEMGPQIPIYALGRYEQVLPFYLEHTMTLVQHTSELTFGLAHEPHLWIPKEETFIEIWIADQAKGKKAIAIMRPENFADLKAKGVPMRVIAQDPRRVAVTNDLKNYAPQ
ncbi:glycosyltransferase family 39 protein [Noviherbaspirillum massiliense]|uniref:glycosyltransferase family 39 protein n=1 Tax=Noviherbaspirillum massiliense TaxID=1465823 RepID=UPI00030CB1DB|nr:glycosyltransferase family 39 protein [Noviherbaspirillum massiliense]